MCASRVTLGSLVLLLAVAIAGCGNGTEPPAASVAPEPTQQRTSVPGVTQTTIETPSYGVEIWTGPALTMMMSFPIMSALDQGQRVNRHLEVHIFDVDSGVKMTGVMPVVTITDQATGASRELAEGQEAGASRGTSFVTACLISKHREVQPHFGDNLYLPDGSYTITVGIGNETAVFEGIDVETAG